MRPREGQQVLLRGIVVMAYESGSCLVYVQGGGDQLVHISNDDLHVPGTNPSLKMAHLIRPGGEQERM